MIALMMVSLALRTPNCHRVGWVMECYQLPVEAPQAAPEAEELAIVDEVLAELPFCGVEEVPQCIEP